MHICFCPDLNLEYTTMLAKSDSYMLDLNLCGNTDYLFVLLSSRVILLSLLPDDSMDASFAPMQQLSNGRDRPVSVCLAQAGIQPALVPHTLASPLQFLLAATKRIKEKQHQDWCTV